MEAGSRLCLAWVLSQGVVLRPHGRGEPARPRRGSHSRPPQPPDQRTGGPPLPPCRLKGPSRLRVAAGPGGRVSDKKPTGQQHLLTGRAEESRKGRQAGGGHGDLQGPPSEQGLLQGARGKPPTPQHARSTPRFTKVAVRRKQRSGSEMSADRGHGLGPQTPHPSPKGGRGKNQGEEERYRQCSKR